MSLLCSRQRYDYNPKSVIFRPCCDTDFSISELEGMLVVQILLGIEQEFWATQDINGLRTLKEKGLEQAVITLKKYIGSDPIYVLVDALQEFSSANRSSVLGCLQVLFDGLEQVKVFIVDRDLDDAHPLLHETPVMKLPALREREDFRIFTSFGLSEVTKKFGLVEEGETRKRIQHMLQIHKSECHHTITLYTTYLLISDYWAPIRSFFDEAMLSPWPYVLGELLDEREGKETRCYRETLETSQINEKNGQAQRNPERADQLRNELAEMERKQQQYKDIWEGNTTKKHSRPQKMKWT